MNIKTHIFSVCIAIACSGNAVADHGVPPSGPYHSTDLKQNNQPISSDKEMRPDYADRFSNDYPQRKMAEMAQLMKQRQAEIQELIKQQRELQQKEWERMASQQYMQPPEEPEWVKKQRQQMEQMRAQMYQAPIHPSMQQRNYFRQPAPSVQPNQTREQHANQMRQYFPQARGPIFGPNVPPNYFAPPGVQPPNYRNAYPPVRN